MALLVGAGAGIGAGGSVVAAEQAPEDQSAGRSRCRPRTGVHLGTIEQQLDAGHDGFKTGLNLDESVAVHILKKYGFRAVLMLSSKERQADHVDAAADQ